MPPLWGPCNGAVFATLPKAVASHTHSKARRAERCYFPRRMNRLTESELAINPRETGLAPLDMATLFGNANPVVLEIGSGKGRFLLATAMERPDVNVLGIEKSLHYHRVIRDRFLKRDLRNIRLINHDAFVVLQKMLPDASIAEVHIYFPDPWPKKRERKRRIIRPEVLAEIRRVLVEGGSGIYVTDHEE